EVGSPDTSEGAARIKDDDSRHRPDQLRPAPARGSLRLSEACGGGAWRLILGNAETRKPHFRKKPPFRIFLEILPGGDTDDVETNALDRVCGGPGHRGGGRASAGKGGGSRAPGHERAGVHGLLSVRQRRM